MAGCISSLSLPPPPRSHWFHFVCSLNGLRDRFLFLSDSHGIAAPDKTDFYRSGFRFTRICDAHLWSQQAGVCPSRFISVTLSQDSINIHTVKEI